MTEQTPNNKSDDNFEDFAMYQGGVIYALFQDMSFWDARRAVAETLRGYHKKIEELQAEVIALKNPKYAIVSNENWLSGLSSDDYLWEIKREEESVLPTGGTGHEAHGETSTPTTPAYRVKMNYDKYNFPYMYQCVIMRGDDEIKVFDWCDDSYMAEIEADDFIENLKSK